MTPSRFLAAAALVGAVTLTACGAHQSAAPADAVTAAPAATSIGLRGARSRLAAPVLTTPAPVVAPTTPVAPSATTIPAPAPSGSSVNAAQSAEVTQDLAGISSQLAAAGQDLQDGPAQQSLDPHG